MTIPKKVAIIGAGLAGLTLARTISSKADVTVFEKSRGVGGRLATRRQADAVFDHGAQYFTVRNARFHNAIEGLIDDGVVQAWGGGIVSIDAGGEVARRDIREPLFVGVPTMTAFPKAMSDGLDIVLNAQVQSISGEPGHWLLTFADRTLGPFDWVLSTAPAPQSAAILPDAFCDRTLLQSVKMNACFTLMLTLENHPGLAFTGAHVDHPVIGWIGVNSSKPERPELLALTVNTKSQWADVHIDDALDAVRDTMLASISDTLRLDAEHIAAADIHFWRYANVEHPAGVPFLLDRTQQLAACGDWCIGNRVEAAFLSGAGLGDALIHLL